MEGWTSCCEAAVTFSETALCCKGCWHEVDRIYLDPEQGAALDAIVHDVIRGNITGAQGVARQKALLKRKINGCEIIREANGVSMIEHPAGFMIYNRGPRIATLKTRAGADRRFDREVKANG